MSRATSTAAALRPVMSSCSGWAPCSMTCSARVRVRDATTGHGLSASGPPGVGLVVGQVSSVSLVQLDRRHRVVRGQVRRPLQQRRGSQGAARRRPGYPRAGPGSAPRGARVNLAGRPRARCARRRRTSQSSAGTRSATMTKPSASRSTAHSDQPPNSRSSTVQHHAVPRARSAHRIGTATPAPGRPARRRVAPAAAGRRWCRTAGRAPWVMAGTLMASARVGMRPARRECRPTRSR